jgi:hypothetical protein
MSTQLFLLAARPGYHTGTNDANLIGTNVAWTTKALGTARGGGVEASSNTATVTGPTNGVEILFGSRVVWYSDPLDADVTISGSITWNIWASENNMSANVAINGRLEVIDGATGVITLIDQTARVTEVAVTTRAANNFAETPAAGVACKRGDRLRVRIFGDDAGTMASTFTFNSSWNGSSAAADGDTYLTLTEDLIFASEPAGTQVFLTDTASDVATASVDREAWTSRGAGVQTDVTNTAAGFTAPLQVTDTAAGTVVDWFTKPLTAVTIGGAVRCNIRGFETTGSAEATFRVEVAIVAGDGTGPVVWAATTFDIELTTSEAVQSFLVSGDDAAVTDGQRLRVRLYIDEYEIAMVTGHTVTLDYAGTSGGASGDTYLTFTQTLTEFTAAAERVPRFTPYPQLLAH